MKLSTNQINYLNIGLMLFSCAVAFALPFELFLFSYAVLGPLHYLTEISWLHDKHYFTGVEQAKRRRRAKRYWLILVSATMCVLLFGFVAEKTDHAVSPKWEITMFYSVFVAALLVSLIENTLARALVIVIAAGAFLLFNDARYYAVLAFFIVTIIHVLLFTGAFILFGALKSRSASGILSLAVFVLCAASFFLIAPESARAAGDYIRGSYQPFNALNAELLRLFGFSSGVSGQEIYESSKGLMIMRLIAFAYTYHYLNWFSKTSIIRWHEIPKSRTVLIVALWIISLAIYARDYTTGMAALYFLSILHVMLEFPLNHYTFAGIARELYAIAK